MDLKLVQVLLDRDANANAKDDRGRTPLHRVLADRHYADEDRFGVAQLLMGYGADVNTPDDDDETLLHLASRRVSIEMAWILLKHGADRNVENTEGKIPFQVVRESIREEMKRPPPAYSRTRRARGFTLMGLLYCY
jgi:ankyrin repeat protein